MGCQFINAHNTTISQVLNCNTNIQIGDASQVFYSTLYTSKSTQEEDNEKQIRTGRAVIKRIKRVLEETPDTISENTQEGKEPSFAEGLSRVLSGLNAATTRNVISATMAHLIPCNNGSRFV
jgi:predicted fused transcriptional regulator/phosphomethylpyrimidine kinase